MSFAPDAFELESFERLTIAGNVGLLLVAWRWSGDLSSPAAVRLLVRRDGDTHPLSPLPGTLPGPDNQRPVDPSGGLLLEAAFRLPARLAPVPGSAFTLKLGAEALVDLPHPAEARVAAASPRSLPPSKEQAVWVELDRASTVAPEIQARVEEVDRRASSVERERPLEELQLPGARTAGLERAQEEADARILGLQGELIASREQADRLSAQLAEARDLERELSATRAQLSEAQAVVLSRSEHSARLEQAHQQARRELSEQEQRIARLSAESERLREQLQHARALPAEGSARAGRD